MCSPGSSTAEFASQLRRPALIDLPASVVSTLFGEMGQETLLASQYAVPAALTNAGFRFLQPTLPEALRAALRE